MLFAESFPNAIVIGRFGKPFPGAHRHAFRVIDVHMKIVLACLYINAVIGCAVPRFKFGWLPHPVITSLAGSLIFIKPVTNYPAQFNLVICQNPYWNFLLVCNCLQLD